MLPGIRNFGHIAGRDISEVVVCSADGAIEASVIELGAALRDMKVRRANGFMQWTLPFGAPSAANWL